MTVIGPVVAPVGTVATIRFGVEDTRDALTPLNCTELLLITELKPVPVILTFVPDGPCLGLKEMMERSVEAYR